MPRLKPYRCRALLVLLLLGFTAATLHASIHIPSDQQSCQFCSGHSNPTHALAPASQLPVFGPAVPVATEFVLVLHHSRSFTAYRQRAPPLST